MKSVIKLLAIFALMLGICSCATVHEVKARYYRNVDLSKFKTYRWASNTPQITGSARGDKFAVDARIRNAVDVELGRKGYVDAGQDPVAFYIDYQLALKEEVKTLPIGDDFTSVDERTGGKLTIDILDPETGNLWWRGSADAQVYKYSFLSKKMRVIERAAKDILYSVPDCR